MFYQTEFIVMKKLAEINSENLFPAKKEKTMLNGHQKNQQQLNVGIADHAQFWDG